MMFIVFLYLLPQSGDIIMISIGFFIKLPIILTLAIYIGNSMIEMMINDARHMNCMVTI